MVLIFTLQPFLQRSAPRPPKIPKIAPQLASRWPARPCLGPSWLHLGPILPPSSPILLPFWAPRACPKSAKICQDSLLDIFLPKVAPKTSQTPSRPRFSRFRGRFFDLSGSIFLGFLLPVSSFLCGLPQRADLRDFLWERSSTKVPKGRKGPAVLAAGVFDIRRPLATGVTEPRLF